MRYQLWDGPHAGEPTTDRGEIERLARECRAAECHAGLDSTVIETRFNVVRSSMPDLVTTARKLRDYLPTTDHRNPPKRGKARFDEAATIVAIGFRRDHGPSAGPHRR